MRNVVLKNPDRRRFLRDLPVAAVAGLALADISLLASPAAAQSMTAGAAPGSFQVFTAEEIQSDIKALQAKPGNKSLVDSKPFTMVLTTETAKSAKEFEWHEGRDHIFHIIEGSTTYQLGGTPKGAHNNKAPGEWLAPESEGATTVTLNQGDRLIVPRGTPHKRSTAGTVTFMLISPQGTV